MKNLLIAIIILTLGAFSMGLGINKFSYGECSSGSTDLEYRFMHFKAFDSTNYDFVSMDACNWSSIAWFEDKPTGVSSGTISYEFDEV